MWKKLVPIGSNIGSYFFYYIIHGYCNYSSNSCSTVEPEVSSTLGDFAGVIFVAAACIYPYFVPPSLLLDYLTNKYFISIFLPVAVSIPCTVVAFPLRVSLIY